MAAFLRPAKPLVRLALAKLRRSRPQGRAWRERHCWAQAARARSAPRHSDARERGAHLHALRTDYLDYLFVHEPPKTLLDVDELARTADALKAEGKIRAWGLAFYENSGAFHASYLSRFDVLQFDNSPGAPNYEAVVAREAPSPTSFSRRSGGARQGSNRR